jgi:predicted DNA-binding protein (MmcQ/YjbR family)
MDLETLQTYCLSMPGATECVQWGHDLLFKVGDKMFVAVGLDTPNSLSIKCDDTTFNALIEREGIVPAPYLARYKWVMLETLSTIPDRELKSLIRQSYDMVRAKLPKKVQATLEAAS